MKFYEICTKTGSFFLCSELCAHSRQHFEHLIHSLVSLLIGEGTLVRPHRDRVGNALFAGFYLLALVNVEQRHLFKYTADSLVMSRL